MNLPASGPAADIGATRVTAIDLWKTAAVLLMFVDHYGHFFASDETIWRAIGRACLPIWFFLIGYARTRGAPWSWFAAGAMLTALDVWSAGDWSDVYVNILINFALIRLALPFVERYVLTSWLYLAALAIILAAAEPLVGKVLEYGSVGWVLALAGLMHRQWRDRAGQADESQWRWARIAVAAFGLVIFIAVENDVYHFPAGELVLMSALLAAAVAGLYFFRSGPAVIPAGVLTPVLRFAGRHTLAIYFVHLAALMIYAGLTRDAG